MTVEPRRGYRFVNWARNLSCSPLRYHQPDSEAQIAELLASAQQAGQRVRFVGAGHSWTNIACTSGHLVNLDRMKNVLEVDAEAQRVTVEAGIRLEHLSVALAGHGLALHNLGSISNQSIAGAIATATHGTGAAFGNLASQVVGLRLVTPAGELRDLTRDRDPELMRAASVGLGCLGAVTRVTLQCERDFNLAERSQVIPFKAAVARLDRLAESAEHVRLWWLPHTGRVWVNRYWRTEAPARSERRVGRWLDSNLMRPPLFPRLLRLGSTAPPIIPSINKVVSAARFRRVKRVEWGPRLFDVPGMPRHYETEWALARSRGADGLLRLEQAIGQLGLRLNFIVELRWVKADDNWLSPSFDRDSCYIGAYAFPTRDWRRYFDAFESVMTELEGRPHWGKAFRWDRDYLRRVYPRFDDFDAVRRELDPDGVLANDFTRRLFGD